MTIRNPVLLKRPWLGPIFTTVGGAYVFTTNDNLGIAAKTAIFAGVVVGLNVFFFVSLRTTRNRTPPTLPISPANERRSGSEERA